VEEERNTQRKKSIPLFFSVASVTSVLLIRRFFAWRAEMLLPEAIPAGIWSSHFWLRLRRAVLESFL
jgi:hypothetical protein